MVKATVRLHTFVQRVLAGMAKGGVPKVVRQGHRLGQLLVQAQGARNRPRHLRHLYRVGQPRAEMVALMLDKHLRFVLEPPKRG